MFLFSDLMKRSLIGGVALIGPSGYGLSFIPFAREWETQGKDAGGRQLVWASSGVVATYIEKQGKKEENSLEKLCQGNNTSTVVGLGISKSIKKTQSWGDRGFGLKQNELKVLACEGGGKAKVVGNPANFFYGILDFENVIVELVNAAKKSNGEIVGWNETGGKWKDNAKETEMKEFDDCYRKKLPKLGEELKGQFSGSNITNGRQIRVDETTCSDKKFGNLIMNIYNKAGKSSWQNGSGDWGKYLDSYGDRLSNIRVGEKIIATGDWKVYVGLPKEITFTLKK